MITEIPAQTSVWKRKFAYFPFRLQPAGDSIHEAYHGNPDQPDIRIWWEYYEQRYTGRACSLFNQYEFRVRGREPFTAWIRNGYD